MRSFMVHNIKTIIGPQSILRPVTEGRRIETRKMTANVNVRWAFHAVFWEPTEHEIRDASSYIQPEERERISKFFYKEDAKLSLVGRLMMRKFVHIATGIPYEEVRFGRDEHGKPFLVGAGDMAVSFNVSHHGDYVVLAGKTGGNVGIDVMRIEPPLNKNMSEFFRLMKRQFSEHEWSTILSQPNKMFKLACFYRMWCLKESYVKNKGFGITVALDQISFAINSQLTVGSIVTDTKLYERGVLQTDWIFEETLLDTAHAVAVAVEVPDTNGYEPQSFEVLEYEDLVREAHPLHDPDFGFAKSFIEKPIKPF